MELSEPESRYSDYPFKPRELTGVCLGLHCSEEDQKDIVALLCQELEPVSVSRARMAGGSVKFAFEAIR